MTIARALWLVTLIGFFGVNAITFAADIDEADLFKSEDSIQKIDAKETLDAAIETESTHFTGQLFSRSLYSIARSGNFDSNTLLSYSQANIFMDTRLKKGAKVFLNVELSQLASSNASTGTLATIREVFLDFNINRAIYIRTGKQVLQWGRSYFWNPTDLVNTEQRDFFQLNRFRDGSYGTRVHVPFGAEQNIYLFFNQQNATNIDKIAVAAKYEFLIGNSEVGLSTWQKKNAVSLYGIDFSTRFWNLDVKGESSFSFGENIQRVKLVNDTATLTTLRGEWANKSSITVQKTWDWDLPERIALTGELFYNSGGYNQSTFANTTIKTALLNNTLYIPNMNNQWYASLFSTITKFPITDMTLGINILSNLTDASNITGCSVSYTPIDHLTFSGTVYGYWGDPNGEYTYAGNGLSTEFSGTVEF
ncbi:hypothetical protein EBR57_01475 [bacterium]|nr:hypothetical protein [bacterium]